MTELGIDVEAHVVVAVNPKAGARARPGRIDHIVNELSQRSFRVSTSDNLFQSAATANRLFEQGMLRALIVGGGDGTVSAMVNETLPGVPIAVLPMGTENLLAKHLGVTQNCTDIIHAVVSDNHVVIDAGRANGRLFLLVASCGFDAEVIHQMAARRNGHIRRGNYFGPLLRSVWNYRYPEIRLYCEGAEIPQLSGSSDYTAAGNATSETHQCLSCRWAFVFNAPQYACGIPLADEADCTDGKLDVKVFMGGSLWHGLRYLHAVTRRRHAELHDCASFCAGLVRLESDTPVPLQLDGDSAGFLPVEIQVLPRRVTLCATKGVAGTSNGPIATSAPRDDAAVARKSYH